MTRILSAVAPFSLLLSGCGFGLAVGDLVLRGPAFTDTVPVSLKDARQVPDDRLLAYQEKSPEYRLLIVTRDKGPFGGGCFIGLEINGVLSGRFESEESAHFYIPSSEPAMRVVPDPLGKGLCSSRSWKPVDEYYVLSAQFPNIFRISVGGANWPPRENKDKAPRLLPSMASW